MHSEYPWQTYQVGGAVRDRLLGLSVKEVDYVVVGATPEQLLQYGFTQVGKDFPVFLHPQTKAEYALARTERKSGQGYHGFVVHADVKVTLEQDLQRRDLTINAIAQNNQGQLIDPYNGQADLQKKVLRHVSNAFVEDPLRVLRLARFHAYLHHLGFIIAPETMHLAQQVVSSGELSSLAKERLWQETLTALTTPSPWVYFASLQALGVWQKLIPDMAYYMTKKPNPLSFLQAIAGQIKDPYIRLALFTHQMNRPQLETLGKALNIPNACLNLCMQVSRYQRPIRQYPKLNAAQKLTLLENCRALHNKAPPANTPSLGIQKSYHFMDLVNVCSWLQNPGQQSLPNLGLSDNLQKQIKQDIALIKAIPIDPFVAKGLKGTDLGNAIRQARIAALVSQGD